MRILAGSVTSLQWTLDSFIDESWRKKNFDDVLVNGAVWNESAVPVAVKYRPLATSRSQFTATDHVQVTVIKLRCKQT